MEATLSLEVSMQVYATIGSNRIDDAMSFYGALLGSIGWARLFDNPAGGCFYGSIDEGIFGVVAPYDGKPATAGNGAMAGFAFGSREAVNAFHAEALRCGATDEGAPGDRGGGSYFAYFRDLDGNKLCAWTFARAR
jgi:catechol 2,3-dioxygenase-like lactoylglutathione lyase family enzyme